MSSSPSSRSRRVFRHFPVTSKHPRDAVLAHAAEAVALQGWFWEFHDSLYEDHGRLDDPHLWQRCEELGLDLDRFEADRRSQSVAERVERDFNSGIRAGVATTPTLFVGGSLPGCARGHPAQRAAVRVTSRTASAVRSGRAIGPSAISR